MRHVSLALLLSLPFFAGSAFAVTGIDGIRWQTQFQNGDGSGYSNCDVEIDGFNGQTFPDSSSYSADGSLQVTSQGNPVDGVVTSFSGTWMRGGQSGTFTFRVIYSNGQPSALRGYYTNSDIGNGHMELPWDSL